MRVRICIIMPCHLFYRGLCCGSWSCKEETWDAPFWRAGFRLHSLLRLYMHACMFESMHKHMHASNCVMEYIVFIEIRLSCLFTLWFAMLDYWWCSASWWINCWDENRGGENIGFYISSISQCIDWRGCPWYVLYPESQKIGVWIFPIASYVSYLPSIWKLGLKFCCELSRLWLRCLLV